MAMKSFGKTILAASLGMIVLNAGAAHAQQIAANSLSMSKVKVAMPFTVLVQRAALEASLRTGAFKKEGLEVEVIRFRSWSEPVQAIAGNAAQFALGGGGFIRAVVGRKAPVRAIALVSSRLPYAFYVKKSSGITSIAELKGKTIQTVRTGETLDNVWRQILGAAGLKMSDVKRVESFNGFGTLASGQAQAANISSNWIGKGRKAGFMQLVDYNEWRKKKGLPTNQAANLGWGTSLKMLKEHPDTVKAFLRALTRSTVMLKTDKAFAVSVLMAKPFAMDEATANEVYALHRDHWMVRLDPSKGDYSFDAEMTEIVLKRPKGSIDIKAVSALGPIRDVLKEMNVTF
jgi:NitT/TauT family transport system substrate-binding protein